MVVVTHWNYSLDMIEHCLEQEVVVAAECLSPAVRRNSREIDALDNSDILKAEDIVKPLKAITVLSKEHSPTVFIIVTVKYMIKRSMG